jgi:serine/threonine protein kinase
MQSDDEFQTKLFPEASNLIESLRASFQDKLESGGATSIESWMERVPFPLKSTAFSDLLLIKLRFRQNQKLGSDRESYRQRFPDFVEQVESCFDLVEREVFAAEATVSAEGTFNSPQFQPALMLQKPAVQPAGKSPRKERGWQAGQTVGMNGRYRLDKRVGKGGFGEVWKGYDANFQQTIAIKVPRHFPENNEVSCTSFLDEARKQRSVDYQGIVKIFDADEMDSAFFIISEFIEGPTLAAQIQSGALSCHRAVEIVHSLALSLDKAHQQRLYHRDIKPANILLRPNGSPVITDFGLAISEAEQLGRGRSFDGTYSHMSPEQARGEVDLLDGRSDIYSLGVILFELLTGRLPFLGTSRNELLHQIINKPALPLRTLKPTIPAKLDEICLKCLAKDPTQRYATGQDLADALKEWEQSNEKLEPLERSVNALLAEIPPSPAQRKQLLPRSYRLGMATMFLIPIFSWAIYRWPEPKPPVGPDSPSQVWLSMLKKPVDPIVQIRVEETDFLQQDTNKSILTARTEGGPWIIAASTSGAPPLRMQCKLFMDNWVGMAGLAWGISPEDRDDPASMPRCYAVIIERFTATDPLRVSLREFHTQKNVPDQTMIGPQAILSSKEISLPKTSPTHFEVTIDPAGVTVLIDKTQEWKPLIVEPRVMEDLKTINGRIGFILRGKTVSISDAAVKF